MSELGVIFVVYPAIACGSPSRHEVRIYVAPATAGSFLFFDRPISCYYDKTIPSPIGGQIPVVHWLYSLLFACEDSRPLLTIVVRHVNVKLKIKFHVQSFIKTPLQKVP